MILNDAHCHFFSRRLFEALASQKSLGADAGAVSTVTRLLEWDEPGEPETLADRWVAELDKYGVRRAALIASVPGDEASVASAVARHPTRFVGMFMLDPTAADAERRTRRAFAELKMAGVCLYPAMQQFSLLDARAMRIFDIAAEAPGRVAFVHCGVLSIGVRKRLGLSSPFDMRFGNPLDLQTAALRHPSLTIVVPHFGAGFFREALMTADLCQNVIFDTSSSNGWIKYHPGLTLDTVFRQALGVVGPERLIFGTDSSFFPRGWQKSVYDSQREVLERFNVDDESRRQIFSGNFDRLLSAG
jgi:predicted TIM-barrel fold metal-dependent hydrolase